MPSSSFIRAPDKQPRPQDYLRAGVPRPNLSVRDAGRGAQLKVVGTGELPDLTQIQPADAPGGNYHTVVDEDGSILGVVAARSHQYLARPRRGTPWFRDADPVEWHRGSKGILEVSLGPRSHKNKIQPRSEPLDPSTARIVTFDSSVFMAGLTPALFSPDDALFVSVALVVDATITITQRPEYALSSWTSTSWPLTDPVPLDTYVLAIYKQLVFHAGGLDKDRDLDQTDLLVAATAILYEAPLYTTKPEAYKGLRNGLKVLKYGPVRNKEAAATLKAYDADLAAQAAKERRQVHEFALAFLAQMAETATTPSTSATSLNAANIARAKADRLKMCAAEVGVPPGEATELRALADTLRALADKLTREAQTSTE